VGKQMIVCNNGWKEGSLVGCSAVGSVTECGSWDET